MKPFIKDIYGDKTTKAEPEHHEFRFPGGTVNVQRTTDGEYWVHIGVNKGVILDEVPSLSKSGSISDSRIDLTLEQSRIHGIPSIPHIEHAEHIAVRIKTQ